MLSSRRERIVSFFLTLNAKNLIKETLPRALMSGAKFDVKGESIDEERNEEESARQEKKEVARAELNPVGPEQSGPIRFWRRQKIENKIRDWSGAFLSRWATGLDLW